MAASNLNLGKASGGVLNIQPADGTTNTSLVLPTSGTVVATDVAVTDNAIARYDGTTGKVQNSGVVIDDNINVLVNTSNSIGKLTIKQSDEFRGINIVSAYNTNEWGITCDGSNSLRFSYNGNGLNSGEKIRIDSNGNVGIGVTPSAWISGYTRAIEIGNAQANGTIWSSLNSNYSHIGIGANFYMDSSFTPRYKASYAASQYSQAIGNHYWQTAPVGTAGNNITWNTAMTLNSSGNLLVGTTTDNGVDKLQVNGSITSKSSGYKYSNLNNACTVDENTIVDNSCLNIPYNDYGYVTIQVSAPYLYCMQTFVGLNAPARFFVRVMAGGNWSSWVEK